MQWDVERVRNLEAKHLPPAYEMLKRRQADIQQRVNLGVLDPALLAATPLERVRFGGAFDYTLSENSAYTIPGQKTIVLDKAPTREVVGHEDMHLRGGFSNDLWNEGSTELLNQVVLRSTGLPVESHQSDDYPGRLSAVQLGMQLGGLTAKDLSKVYAGNDHAANFDSLRATIQETAGFDVVTLLTELFDQKVKKYGPDKAEGSIQRLTESMKSALEIIHTPDFEDMGINTVQQYREDGMKTEAQLFQGLLDNRERIMQTLGNKKK